MRKYTDDTQIPILKEFCFNNEIDYKYFLRLCANDENLDKERCRLLSKKEIQLEKALMLGANNTAFIFQLKQLGWKDVQQEMTVNTSVSVEPKQTVKQKLNKLTAEERDAYFGLCEKMNEVEK